MHDLEKIQSVAIHPAIGIARVGNSPNEYFFGPEVPGPHPDDPRRFRDPVGRIKRQAARFRVFGLDADGRVIREITAADGEVHWAVHVANNKAAWYRFDQALDIPASKGEISGVPAIASARRNADVTGADRDQLVIDPGQRVISGRNVNAHGKKDKYAFDSGTFYGRSVYLGELRTDADGHLIFLGGRGLSQYKDPDQENPPVPGFANNPGWHDDTSDGPVNATVKLNNGKELTATGAWVIVAPPNYAPGIEAFITGYDQVFEVATELDPSHKADTVRFYQDIYPLLRRLTLNQWVNAGLARDNGWGSPSDFTYENLIQRLSDPGDNSRPLRQAIFSMFRNPDYEVMEANEYPQVYGDAVTLDINTTDPREWMAILPFQSENLERWAAGDFEADPPPDRCEWDRMTPAERAAGLDRAALAETTGGPYHPGCEFTWPMRQKIMYAAPFRLKRRASPACDYGDQLTSSIALAPGGPLDGSDPGDVTRWMACPWQTDTSSCLSGYKAFSGEYLPTFWPARVPNDILTEESYKILMDRRATIEQKEKAFSLMERKKWLRDIVYTDSYPAQRISTPNPRAKFITDWDKVGIVVRQPGPKDTPLFPGSVWVETGRSLTLDEPAVIEEHLFTGRSLMSQR